MFLAVVLSFFVVDSFAQITFMEPCKQLVPMENFNRTKFMGKWYLYANYPTNGVAGRCPSEELESNSTGALKFYVKVLSTGPKSVPLPMRVYEAQFEGPTITNIHPVNAPLFNATLLILSTDYVSYAVRGYCENVGPSSSSSYIYIDTRSPEEPSEKLLEKISRVFKDEGIPEEYMVRVDQTNCPNF